MERRSGWCFLYQLTWLQVPPRRGALCTTGLLEWRLFTTTVDQMIYNHQKECISVRKAAIKFGGTERFTALAMA